MQNVRSLVALVCMSGSLALGAACSKSSANADTSADGTEATTSDTDPSASDTESGEATSMGTTTDDTDSGFIEPPDGGVAGQCDPGMQDCPNDDEKCTAYVTTPGECCVDATKCVPIIGNAQGGDDCVRTEDNDDCDKGYFCTTKTSGSTGMGFCEQLCVPGDAGSCDIGTCVPYNDGILPLCRIECDPLLQDCPQMDFGCYPAFDIFVCGKPANDPGEGDDGSDCFTTRSCLPGLACMDASAVANCGARCCSPFCDLTGDPVAQCPEMTEDCVSWFVMGEAPPQYVNVGVCAIPA